MSSMDAPPDGDVNRAPALLVALWLTTSIALIVFAARLYVRIRIIKYHGLDDYWIVASMVSTPRQTFSSQTFSSVD